MRSDGIHALMPPGRKSSVSRTPLDALPSPLVFTHPLSTYVPALSHRVCEEVRAPEVRRLVNVPERATSWSAPHPEPWLHPAGCPALTVSKSPFCRRFAL